MEESRASLPTHQKDSSVPEKPLEKEFTNGSSGNNSNKVYKKPVKASKFKSIFTRPTSNRGFSEESVQGTAQNDASGRGDMKGPNSQRHSSSHNLTHYSNQVQNDGTFRPLSTVKSTNTSKTNITLDHSEETEIIPEPVVSSSRVREAKKKVVTISNENQYHPDVPRQTGRRKNSKKHDPYSQTRSYSEPTKKHDLKSLQRRHSKMKEKTRELLSLVEELTHNCEYYKNALKDKDDREETDCYQFLKEKESLNLHIFKLGQEIDEWKTKCQKMENKNTALFKAKSLTKENKDLLDDIEVLKSVICRLNKELAFYQDRLRFKFHNSPENIPFYSTSSGTDDDDFKVGSGQEISKDWLKYPRRSLLPLLTAYDEAIAEKDEIIRDHESVIDRFKQRCMEVTKENSDLHKLISSNKDNGSISINDWEYLRSNAVLVLEENDLLHDQVDNLKRKEEKLFTTFQEKVAGFKQTIASLETEITRQKGILADVGTKNKTLCEENANLSANLLLKIPKENHEAMIQEFKQAFEELKSNYEADRKNMNDKVVSVEKERERLVEEVSNLEADNTKLRAEIKDCESNLAASTQSLQQMKASILEATSARDATNGVIEDFIKHVKQLVAEKNKLLEDLSEQRLVNEQMMGMRLKENELVGELHEKIEAMELLHNEEVKSIQSRVKELDEMIRTQKDLHRREKVQINELVKEKDRRIETIEAEKKQLQQDLETVWRTTTSTMTTSIKNRHT